jgi:hypothetical protein
MHVEDVHVDHFRKITSIHIIRKQEDEQSAHSVENMTAKHVHDTWIYISVTSMRQIWVNFIRICLQ